MPINLGEASVFDNLRNAISLVLNTAFIWLPIFTGAGLFVMWLQYKRAKFWQSRDSTLLEIRLPKEINKSPLAMEIVLGAFYQGAGEETWIDRYWKGGTRDWSSLEIVSLNGVVKFFIWLRPRYKNIVEAQLYSQYPGIEVHEAKDYTLPVAYDPDKNVVWGCEWALTKADPFPIKTYVDYGLDKDPKEEYKIDPMTSMIEFLGSLTAGNQIWIQIIIRQHKKEQRKLGMWFEKTDAWQDEAKKEVKKIVDSLKGEEGKLPRFATKGEENIITALERSTSKMPFDVGIRSIYIADKDKFNGSNIGGMLGSFKQYGSLNLNGFKPTGGLIGFNYPWQDFTGRRRERIKRHLIEGYKTRQYFFSPYKGKKPFVLNSEELATIYHFPGAVAATPTFERIPSKKSEAPFNLPT